MAAAALASAAAARSVSSLEATPLSPPVVKDAVGLGVGVGRGTKYLQFLVQVQELEVSGGDVAHERDHHAAAGLVGGEIARARRLAQTPDAAPEINFPERVEVELGGAFDRRRSKRRAC